VAGDGVIARVLVAALAGIVLAAGVLLAQRLGTEPSPPPQQAVHVEAALSPGARLFGDVLVAEVAVTVDPRRVDTGSVRLDSDFRPFALRSQSVERDGAKTIWRLELLCLNRACLPQQGKPRQIRIERGFVRFVRDGVPLSWALDWPPVEIASRLTAGDRVRPAMRLPEGPPPAVSWRIEPGLLAALLYCGAALLAAVALVLLALEVKRALAGRRVDSRSPLDRALAFLERARSVPERRKALDRLARVVPDAELADEARTLAWAEPPPGSAEAAALAERAR
jgi:hypothetical protein